MSIIGTGEILVRRSIPNLIPEPCLLYFSIWSCQPEHRRRSLDSSGHYPYCFQLDAEGGSASRTDIAAKVGCRI